MQLHKFLSNAVNMNSSTENSLFLTQVYYAIILPRSLLFSKNREPLVIADHLSIKV